MKIGPRRRKISTKEAQRERQEEVDRRIGEEGKKKRQIKREGQGGEILKVEGKKQD
jgi:hypothetical protein